MVPDASRRTSAIALADSLSRDGWAVAADFAPPDLLEALAREARCLWDEGSFRAARIGSGADQHLAPAIRSDRILWIGSEPTAPQAAYQGHLDELRLAINPRTLLGLFEWEGHLACYPEGTHYRRHLDVFAHHRERKVSTVLYLNQDWQPGDGGELRLWTTPGAIDGPFVDIEPRFGTLVAFLSEDYFHEVLPTRRERFSVTGWFRVRPLTSRG